MQCHAIACEVVRGFVRMCESVQQCTREFKGMQGCVGAFEEWVTVTQMIGGGTAPSLCPSQGTPGEGAAALWAVRLGSH